MSELSDVRGALAGVWKAAAPEIRVYTYEPEGSWEYPCIVISPAQTLEYANRALGWEGVRYTLTAWLYVLSSNPADAWEMIDDYRSPAGGKSLRAAVVANDSLGGIVNYAEVRAMGTSQRAREDPSEINVFSCRFEVDIFNRPGE